MSTNFDYIVIGSGLSGLTVAHRLSQETPRVALLEASEVFGGTNKKISLSLPSEVVSINNGLRVMPMTSSAAKALEFLESQLNLKILKSQSERPPVTYENGQLKSFIGFGEQSPEFYDEIQYFTHNEMINWHLEPYQWTARLFDNFKGQFFPRSIVTRFQIENEKIQSLTINGSKTFKAENYVFCGSWRDLNSLIPEKSISSRNRQKLAKGRYWTAVGLDLIHSKKVTDIENIHILNGTTQDELGPSVGKFLPASTDESCQISQWLTFIDESSTEETEVIASALKKMKRQIRRPYETALENLISERISITPLYSGSSDLKLQGQQSFPEIENLWVASGHANPQKNLVGALLQAQLVLSALGFSETSSPDVRARQNGEINSLDFSNSESTPS